MEPTAFPDDVKCPCAVPNDMFLVFFLIPCDNMIGCVTGGHRLMAYFCCCCFEMAMISYFLYSRISLILQLCTARPVVDTAIV